jgi:hypothetical protein
MTCHPTKGSGVSDATTRAHGIRRGVESCERVTLTRVVTVEGVGTSDDLVRLVTYWFDDDGTCIARIDPVLVERP